MQALLTEPQVPKDAAAVAAHIGQLSGELQAPVREIRRLILDAGSGVGERIKWNQPAFYYTGPMPPSDPKAYAREIAVFNPLQRQHFNFRLKHSSSGLGTEIRRTLQPGTLIF